MQTLTVLACLLAAAGQEKPRPVALQHAKVWTVSGVPLEDATIVIEGAKIALVGKGAAVPADAQVVDLSGKVVIPGLIDAASRLFVEGGDRGPGSPEQSALDALDPYQEGADQALRYGVTTVYINPPSSGPIQGLGAVLRNGKPLVREAALRLSLASTSPDTGSAVQRHELYQQIRQAFEAAREYRKAREKYAKDLAEHEAKKKEDEKKKPEEKKEPLPAPPQKVRTDPRQETLLRALDGALPVRIEAHTADALDLALKLAADFKLKLVLEHATEGGRVAEAIAKAKVPVVAGPMFRYGIPTADYLGHAPETPAALARAGVEVLAIASFGDERAGHWGAGASRFLLEAAALAGAQGLKPEQALAAVTLGAARALGVDKTLGSIEKGKLADLVVLSDDPFDAGSRVERTIVDGVTVYPGAPR